MASYAVDEDIVSIWAATCPLADIPENYFEEKYLREIDEPFNQFCADFGFDWYDHDFVESYCSDDWSSVPIGELLRPEWSSASDQFRDQAIARAQERGVSVTPYVFAIYNFCYDPAKSGVSASRFMQFVGAFPFKIELPDYCK